MREGQEQSQRYYIYSWNVGKPYGLVRIHVAECGYCNDGRGKVYGPIKARGDWQGPFNFESASRLAKSLAVLDTRPCQRCMAQWLADQEKVTGAAHTSSPETDRGD